MKKLSYSECITAVGQLHFCALWCLGYCLADEVAASTWIKDEHLWGLLMMTPVSIFTFGSIYWVFSMFLYRREAIRSNTLTHQSFWPR